MEKLFYLILSEEDGNKLKEVFRDMKPIDAFYGFVDSCIRNMIIKRLNLKFGAC